MSSFNNSGGGGQHNHTAPHSTHQSGTNFFNQSGVSSNQNPNNGVGIPHTFVAQPQTQQPPLQFGPAQPAAAQAATGQGLFTLTADQVQQIFRMGASSQLMNPLTQLQGNLHASIPPLQSQLGATGTVPATAAIAPVTSAPSGPSVATSNSSGISGFLSSLPVAPSSIVANASSSSGHGSSQSQSQSGQTGANFNSASTSSTSYFGNNSITNSNFPNLSWNNTWGSYSFISNTTTSPTKSDHDVNMDNTNFNFNVNNTNKQEEKKSEDSSLPRYLQQYLKPATTVISKEAMQAIKKLDLNAVEFTVNGHGVILTNDLKLFCQIVRIIDGIGADQMIHPILSSLTMNTVGETENKEENEFIFEFLKQIDEKNIPKIQVLYMGKHTDPTDGTSIITVSSLTHEANAALSQVGKVFASNGREATLALKDKNFPDYLERMLRTNFALQQLLHLSGKSNEEKIILKSIKQIVSQHISNENMMKYMVFQTDHAIGTKAMFTSNNYGGASIIYKRAKALLDSCRDKFRDTLIMNCLLKTHRNSGEIKMAFVVFDINFGKKCENQVFNIPSYNNEQCLQLTLQPFLDPNLRPSPLKIPTNILFTQSEKDNAIGSVEFPKEISNDIVISFLAFVSVPAIKKQTFEDEGQQFFDEIKQQDIYKSVCVVQGENGKKLFEVFTSQKFANARKKRDTIGTIMNVTLEKCHNEFHGISKNSTKQSTTPNRLQIKLQPENSNNSNNSNNNNNHNSNNNSYNNGWNTFDYLNQTNEKNTNFQFLSPNVHKARSVSPVVPRQTIKKWSF